MTNLKKVYSDIYNKATYVLIQDKTNYIQCNSFLEYDDCYLVIEDGKERYVSKSTIKEIQKLTNI